MSDSLGRDIRECLLALRNHAGEEAAASAFLLSPAYTQDFTADLSENEAVSDGTFMTAFLKLCHASSFAVPKSLTCCNK